MQHLHAGRARGGGGLLHPVTPSPSHSRARSVNALKSMFSWRVSNVRARRVLLLLLLLLC